MALSLNLAAPGSSHPSTPRPIIIDTDPGQDDAVALMLALACPDELEVLGITAVAGNVPLDLTVKNALSIVELSNRSDVRVYRGCDQPMVRPLVTAEHVHGSTGLDGSDLGDPTLTEADEHAVAFLIRELGQRIGTDQPKVTLCALGPLTNIATALDRQPSIADGIEQIVMMGGGLFEGGNITPTAEFNIFVDPQAAALVFASGLPLVLMPLDVTHKALTTPARIQAFNDLNSPAGDCVAGMLGFFERFDAEKYGSVGGPLHDPTVIAYLLEPEMLTGRQCNVEIETQSELTMGETVIDWWDVTDRADNCFVLGDIDPEAFFNLLVDRIARLSSIPQTPKRP